MIVCAQLLIPARRVLNVVLTTWFEEGVDRTRTRSNCGQVFQQCERGFVVVGRVYRAGEAGSGIYARIRSQSARIKDFVSRAQPGECARELRRRGKRCRSANRVVAITRRLHTEGEETLIAPFVKMRNPNRSIKRAAELVALQEVASLHSILIREVVCGIENAVTDILECV